MEDLSALGNVALVPVVIFVTQTLKKRLNFKRGPDALALLVSVCLCFGQDLYTATPEYIQQTIWGAGVFTTFRWMVDNFIVSFATWLSASKLYDLGYRDKKTDKKMKEIEQKKTELETEIVKLKVGGTHEVVEQNPSVSKKLQDILEGR
jgi:hypothetical protein